MEEDGAFVGAGQKVLEFDNATFAGEIEDKKLTRRKEERELLVNVSLCVPLPRFGETS